MGSFKILVIILFIHKLKNVSTLKIKKKTINKQIGLFNKSIRNQIYLKFNVLRLK